MAEVCVSEGGWRVLVEWCEEFGMATTPPRELVPS
jgi:hypothetical protein